MAWTLPRWRDFSSSVRRPRPGSTRRRSCCRLTVEQLEARELLATITWTGAAGPAAASWHTAGNWDLNRVPAAGDDVVIPDRVGTTSIRYASGTTSLNSLVSSENLLLTGGDLIVTGAAGTSQLNGPLTLSGGRLQAANGLALNAATEWTGGALRGTILNQATLTLSGTNGKSLQGTLRNTGTIRHTGTGNLDFENGTLENRPGAVYDLQSDADFRLFAGTAAFRNEGTFRKSAGTGLTEFRVGFHGTGGTVDVQTGTVILRSGGSLANGVNLVTAAGTTFEINGSTTTLDGPLALSGAGTHRLAGGTLVASGTLAGPTPLQWAEGVLRGTLENRATIHLAGTRSRRLEGTLRNFGTIVHAGGNLDVNRATLHIEAGGLYDFQSDDDITVSGVSTLTNAGTLRKSGGTGISTLNNGANLDNRGTVEALSGTLQLAGGTSSGTFRAGPGAALEFRAGTHVLQAPVALAGDNVRLAGGSLDVSDIVTVPAGQTFHIVGGELRGTGLLFVEGTLNWTAGVMSGIGRTLITRGAALNMTAMGATGGNFRSRTIENFGSAVLRGNDRFDWTNGATFLNHVGATFDAQANTEILQFIGATSQFTNYGLFRRSGGTGTLRFNGVPFTNHGTVEFLTGTIRFSGADYIQVAGSTRLENSSFQVGTIQLQGGDFLGTGTHSGNIHNTGGVVRPGSSPGRFSLAGNYTQGPNGVLAVEIGGRTPGSEFDQVALTGTANLNGTLQVSLANGFVPQPGDSFPVLTMGSRTGEFAAITGLVLGATEALQVVQANTSVALSLAAAADLRVTSVTAPANVTAGGAIAVTYTVANDGGATTRGSWTDGVYLSADTVLDASDVLLGQVTRQGDLTAQGTYTQTLTTTVPGLLPGQYHVLVEADNRQFVADANPANNVAAAPSPVRVDIPALTLGATVSGTIRPGQELFFRLDVPAGLDARIDAVLGRAGAADLLSRHVELPTPSVFDERGTGTDPARPSILLAGPEAGPHFLRLRGLTAAGTGGTTFSLTVSEFRFAVRDFGPNHGSHLGRTTITVHGSGFSGHTTAQLVGAQTRAGQVLLKDDNTLFVTFDLAGMTPGTYAVQVVDRGLPITAPGSFTVNDGAPGQVQLSQRVDGNLPDGRGRLRVEYVNTGETDLVAPLLTVEATGTRVQLAEDTGAFVTSVVQFLGINTDGPAGILPPGYRGTIFVAFQRSSSPNFRFGLSEIVPEATIDWNFVKDDLRPPQVLPEAWDAIFANFLAEVGTSPVQLQAVLADNATRLSQLGVTTADVSRLLDFELMQAENLFPIDVLAQVQDASALSQGLLLAFTRFYRQPLRQRYRLGPLGRGWGHAWEITAALQPDGNVAIEQGGDLRLFLARPGGTFEASPGDFATLNVAPDGFRLREATGVTYHFRLDGRLAFVDDPNGNRIHAEYAEGRLAALVHSNGRRFQLTYNAAGRLATLTDHVGQVTTFGYDAANEHLLTVTGPDGTTTYTYDAGHALTAITYPGGTREDYAYDARGRLIRAVSAGTEEVTTYSHDSAGGYTITDALGSDTYLANELGMTSMVINSLGDVTWLRYDAEFNLTEAVGPNGIANTLTYDNRGNVVRHVDPQGGRVDLTYDPATNQLTSLRDANGNVTRYLYNAQGNSLGTQFPDGSIERLEVDGEGRPTAWTNRRGQTIRYTYDARGRVRRKDVSDGTFVTFEYNDRDLLTEVTDSTGTRRFRYDDLDRLTRIDYPRGRFLVFSYNADDQRTRTEDQDGHITNYAYDAVGRLVRVSDGTGATLAAYTYDSAGFLARKELGNGTFTTYAYDSAGQLLELVNHAPNGSVNSRFAYTYDSLGNPLSMTTLEGRTDFSYDVNGQLVSVRLPTGRGIRYTYDGAGNRLTVDDNGTLTSYTPNAANQYTAVGDAVLVYDQDGNLVSRTQGGQTWTYTYDAENNLVGITSPEGTWRFERDYEGMITAVTHNGQRTEYLLDPTTLVDVLAEYDATGSLVARYAHGLGLLNRTDAAGSAAFYDFDAVGSTVGLTSAAGAYVNRYSYLPFGEVLAAQDGVPNPFRYVGEFGVLDPGGQDDPVGYLMRFRHYDPVLGRFTAPDPIGLEGDDPNYYRYVSNAPLGYIDPDGQLRKSIGKNKGGRFRIGFDTKAGETFRMQWRTGNLKNGNLWHIGYQRGEGLHIAKQYQVNYKNVGPETHWFRNRKAITQGKTLLPGSGFYRDTSKLYRGFSKAGRFAGKLFSRLGGPHATAFFTGYEIGSILNEAFGISDAIAEKLASFLVFIRFGDYNGVAGEIGVGPEGFILPGQNLTYRIRFGNLSHLTTPVQRLTITYQLDADLDRTIFELGGMNIGPVMIEVPPGLQSFQTRVDLRSRSGVFVDVTADYDRQTGLAIWTLTAIDPATGLPPTDPLQGFLPVNETPPVEQGGVTFTVRPRDGLPDGTTIDNQATVTFNGAGGLTTRVFRHTLDGGPPTSSIVALPPILRSRTFTVRWSGEDGAGSGIASYDIFVATDDGLFEPFLVGTTETSAEFTGEDGHRYRFLSLATDRLGNRQASPGTAQASVLIDLVGTANLALTRGSLPATVTAGELLVYTLVITNNGPDAVPEVLLTDVLDASAVVLETQTTNGSCTSTNTATCNLGTLEPGASVTVTRRVLPARAGTLVSTAQVSSTFDDPDLGNNQSAGMVAVQANPFVSFVTALYRDVLRRDPDQDGLSFWVRGLQAGARREDVARGFWESPEHRGQQVDGFYAAYLDRTPASEERAFWVEALRAGLGEAEAARLFLTSPEYLAARGDDAAFLQGLYGDVLGRDADADGLAGWLAALRNGLGRADVVAAFLASPEAQRRLVDHYYAELLDRPADEDGRRFWLTQLHEGRHSRAGVAQAFLASDEYFALVD